MLPQIAHDGQRHGGLATARFSHQANAGTARQGERDIVHGCHLSCRRVIRDVQAIQGQEVRRCHSFHCAPLLQPGLVLHAIGQQIQAQDQ